MMRGKVVNIYSSKMRDATGKFGQIKTEDGKMRDFTKMHLPEGVKEAVRKGKVFIEDMTGWNVEFEPEGERGIVHGTLRQLR